MDARMKEELRFLPGQICWVRMNAKAKYFPAEVMDQEMELVKKTWKPPNNRPMYSVRNFDHDVENQRTFTHVRSAANMKPWTVGLNEHLDHSSVKKVIRAVELANERLNNPIVQRMEEMYMGKLERFETTFRDEGPPRKRRGPLTSGGEVQNRKIKKEAQNGDGIGEGSLILQSPQVAKALNLEHETGPEVHKLAEKPLDQFKERIGIAGLDGDGIRLMENVSHMMDAPVTVLYDEDFHKTKEMADRFKENKPVSARFPSEILKHCDIVLCYLPGVALEGITFLHQLLDSAPVRASSDGEMKTVVLMSAMQAISVNLVEQTIAQFIDRVRVICVAFVGAIGSATRVYTSGGPIDHLQDLLVCLGGGASICSFAEEARVTTALVFGMLQKRLLLGLFKECTAVRALAADYGVDRDAMCALLGSDSDDRLYTGLITASMGGNKDQLKEMDRVLGSVQSCNWVTEALLETAAQSTSRVVAKIDSQLSLAKMFADIPRSASVAETIYTQSGL